MLLAKKSHINPVLKKKRAKYHRKCLMIYHFSIHIQAIPILLPNRAPNIHR